MLQRPFLIKYCSEVELLELIREEVVKNLGVCATDRAFNEGLTCLGKFVEAVGENPPDDLVGLVREVRHAYLRVRPQVEQKLWLVLVVMIFSFMPSYVWT